LGVALLVEGNAEAALPHLEETHMPELLGLAYLETGRLGSAIMALRASLERQPDDPDLLYYYGRATALAAEKTRKQLSKINPQLVSGKDAEGRPLRDVAALQTELAKSPKDPQLLYDFQRAAELDSEKAFERILRTSAASARAHQVTAERAVQGKQLAEAEKEYAEALRLKPYTSGVHLALGNVYANEGNWPAAIQQFRMEAQVRPEDVTVLYRLGVILLQQGAGKEALAALSNASRLRPGTPAILLALGNAALAAKDDAAAQQYWLQLLSIDQKSELAAQAHMGLSSLYKSTGKLAEADRELAAYQEITTQGKH
jgi:cytochrome c-type biogenesis protein CcmH/NrfG